MDGLAQRAENCRSSIDINIFKGYDVRGDAQITPESPKINLREEDAYLIGQAIGSNYDGEARVLVTSDHRPSSDTLRSALAQGFAASGCDVWVCDEPAPTGATSWAILQKRDQFDISIQITGSHNPFYNNGFKITTKQNEVGEPDLAGVPQALYGYRLKKIHAQILAAQVAADNPTGEIHSLSGLIAEYQEAMSQHFKDALDKSGGRFRNAFRVVLDAGNGMGAKAVPILQALGVEVEEMFTELHGEFPNHPADPSNEEGVRMAREKVRELNAALEPGETPWLGMVFDGDGDRCGMIGEDGEVIYPERIVAILYMRFLLQNHEGFSLLKQLERSVGLALDVRGTGVIADFIDEYKNYGYGVKGEYIVCGYPNHRTYVRQQIAVLDEIIASVDSQHVPLLEKMKREYTSAEASGHFFYAVCPELPEIVVDDGIFSALKLLEILDTVEEYEVAAGVVPEKSSYRLIDIFAAIEWRPSSNEIRGGSPYQDAKKAEIIDAIASEIELEKHSKNLFSQDIAEVIDVDGLRVIFTDASFLVVRASQTSPKFTYKFEAHTQQRLVEVIAETISLLRSYEQQNVSLAELEKELQLQRENR